MGKKELTPDEIPFYTRVFSFISLALLIATWIVPLMAYSALPEIVPTHFNLNGEIDGRGSKITIFFIPAIATFTILFFLVMTNSKSSIINKMRKPGPYQLQLSPQGQLRSQQY